jgi:hypothetical protein
MFGLLAAAAASAGSIGLGYFMAERRRQAEQQAKAAELAQKQEMSEVAAYQKSNNWQALDDETVSSGWSHLPAGYLDRARAQARFGATKTYFDNAGDVGTSGVVPYPGMTPPMGTNMAAFLPPPTQAPTSPGMNFNPNAVLAQLPAGAMSPPTTPAPTPPIGGAPWAFPGTERQAGAVPIPQSHYGAVPPAPGQASQALTADTGTILPTRPISTTIEGTDPYTGARTSQPGPTAYSDEVRSEFPIYDQPMTMAERRPPTPQAAAPSLKFPSIKRPQTRQIEGPSGQVSITDKGLDKGSTTTMMLGQAEQIGMPPDQFEREYAEHVIATKGEFPELDHQQLIDYKDRYFGRMVQQKTRELAAAGITDPALLQQQAERIASGQMGNYIPSKGGGLIAFRPEEVQLSRINQATMNMNRELETAIRIVESGGKYAPDFGKSFTDIIDSDASMTPEQKQHIKLTATQNIAQRLIQKADPTDPFGRMKAMMVAANMTGGAVPHEWQQMVMGDPKSFGFSQAMADEYLTGKYNIWEKDGYARLQNAVADKAIQGQLVDQAIKTPEKAGPLMQAYSDLSKGNTTQQALAGMGQAQLQQDVQQRRAESFAGVTGTKEAERIELVKQVSQPISEVSKALRRYMDMSYMSDPEGKTKAGKLYKDVLVANRSVLAKGLTMQTGALNEQEQEAALSSLSQLIEANLAPDIANEKIQIINRTLSKNFGQPVDLLSDDPLNPQVQQALRFDRQGNPVGDTATRMARPAQPTPGMQPSPGMQPTPAPQPVAPPQPAQPPSAVAGMQPTAGPQPAAPAQPAQPAQPTLPPIEQAVEQRKQAAPSEAAPKVGPAKGQPFTPPSNPQAVQAARSAVPDEVKRMLAAEPEFKERLRSAHQQYQDGKISRDELEREVVKVIGRLGSRRDKRGEHGLLEGQALNKAIAAIMDAYTGSAAQQAGAAR